MIGKALYYRLTTSIGSAAIVGTRVYPHEPPTEAQPVYPLIVYTAEGQTDVRTHGGNGTLYSRTVTIAGIDRGYGGVVDLAAAIHTALDNQSGSWGGVTVKQCFFETGSEEVKRISNTPLWVAELDFTIWIQR